MSAMPKSTMPNISTTCASSQIISQEANNFVTRKEAVAKLRVLKLRHDLVHPLKKHLCSFFNLLSDAAYREASLLKLSYQHDALLSAYANQLLELNLVGSLFSESPDLGKEVFIKIYPSNSFAPSIPEVFEFPYAVSNLPHYVSAESL